MLPSGLRSRSYGPVAIAGKDRLRPTGRLRIARSGKVRRRMRMRNLRPHLRRTPVSSRRYQSQKRRYLLRGRQIGGQNVQTKKQSRNRRFARRTKRCRTQSRLMRRQINQGELKCFTYYADPVISRKHMPRPSRKENYDAGVVSARSRPYHPHVHRSNAPERRRRKHGMRVHRKLTR